MEESTGLTVEDSSEDLLEFEEEVEKHVEDQRERAVVLALRDVTISCVDELGGMKNVLPMDVWTGVFSMAGSTS